MTEYQCRNGCKSDREFQFYFYIFYGMAQEKLLVSKFGKIAKSFEGGRLVPPDVFSSYENGASLILPQCVHCNEAAIKLSEENKTDTKTSLNPNDIIVIQGYSNGQRRQIFVVLEADGETRSHVSLTPEVMEYDAETLSKWFHAHLPVGTYMQLIRSMADRYNHQGSKLAAYGIQITKINPNEIINEIPPITPSEEKVRSVSRAFTLLNSKG